MLRSRGEGDLGQEGCCFCSGCSSRDVPKVVFVNLPSVVLLNSKWKSGHQKPALVPTEADLWTAVVPVYMRFLLKEHGLL